MPLNPKLVAAYEKVHYVVYSEPQLILRIDDPDADLDALLADEGASTAAYVTAANPRGKRTSEEANRAATRVLHESQVAAGYACYEGEGRDPDGRWRAEPSLLVVGISRADAEALGRTLRQNAIVFVERGRAPELLVLVE